ncbi:MAG: hypothetical protein ACTHU0_14210 [Kofleriaceae bacterium]
MRRCWIVTLLLSLCARAAWADRADDAYQEGRKLYDLREWDAAIAKFKESYKLRPDPRPLFNIAQAYRLKGDCVEAAGSYRTYKRNYPSANNLDKVEKLLAELEPCVKAAETTPKAAPTPTPSTLAPPPTPKATPIPTSSPSTPPMTTPSTSIPTAPTTPMLPPSPAPSPHLPGRNKQLAGLVTGGVGLLAIGAGAYFAIDARRTAHDVTNGSGEWDPSVGDAGERASARAALLLGIGGAAVLTGSLLYVLGRRDAERGQLAIVPRTHGAGLVWTTAF